MILGVVLVGFTPPVSGRDAAAAAAARDIVLMSIFSPFVALLSVAIAMLALLLFVGVITEAGRPVNQSASQSVSQSMIGQHWIWSSYEGTQGSQASGPQPLKF